MYRIHRNNIELNECFSNTKKDSQKNKSVHQTRQKLFTQSGLRPQFCNTGDWLPLYCCVHNLQTNYLIHPYTSPKIKLGASMCSTSTIR